MTPVELSRTVLRAVRSAVVMGELKVAVPERAVVTVPGAGGSGEYATNIALQLARPAGQSARRVAEILSPYLLRADDGIRDVVVTGPGFLNFSLAGSGGLVSEVLRSGVRYGHVDQGTGQVVRLRAPQELRALVVMDSLARILRSQGVGVETGATGQQLHDHPGVVVRPVPAPSDPFVLGADAGRWALLYPAPHDRPRIGGEHLVQRESNPLFRVRYAHARTRALSSNAADLGFGAVAGDAIGMSGGPYGSYGSYGPVLAAVSDHPRVLAAAATHHDPSRLARHLVVVADAVMPVLPGVLPRGGEKPSATHRARLALVEAVGAVLAGGLSLLGIDAPDHL
ncbi:ArgS-related anticodon-binding protein NrtL [Streptomyces sp. NPDC059477]|uniref:ArgS-related anticodon-binding protein NrtL n=1 Tax=Streptomyces sp. NPDC059477 TaxID=3346847 RepID=UPI00369B789E